MGKALFVLAGSPKCTFSTSPAVSIEESKRAAAVLARCSIDLPIVLFVPMQKTLSLVLSELSGKFLWGFFFLWGGSRTLAFNFMYALLCPRDGCKS